LKQTGPPDLVSDLMNKSVFLSEYKYHTIDRYAIASLVIFSTSYNSLTVSQRVSVPPKSCVSDRFFFTFAAFLYDDVPSLITDILFLCFLLVDAQERSRLVQSR
jgi:hypothetical protein